MGIVLSTFVSWALQIAWNCQRLLDPRYRCLENKCEISPAPSNNVSEVNPAADGTASSAGRPEDCYSGHHESRNHQRAQQVGHRKRTASHDGILVSCSTGPEDNSSCSYKSNRRKKYANSRLAGSRLNSPAQIQQARYWELTSTSGCSSDSGTDLGSDSEVERRSHIDPDFDGTKPDGETDEARGKLGMSAAEEAAFRLTVGRGYFSRSKKDRFLKHLRLEKRLNDLNKEFFEVAYRAHSRAHHRHHSGDLHRIA